jgi:predicted nuclease of restriction endonuclease-like (RecB) superfamily
LNVRKERGGNMNGKIKLIDYRKLFDDIQFLLNKAHAQAYKAVDNIRVQTYWQIGERIAREELKYKNRAFYSKKVIKQLAGDLGFSRVILYRILQFYQAYPIVSTVSRQLGWSHIVELLGIKSSDERKFYELSAIKNVWSVRELREQIKDNLYFRKTNRKLAECDSISLLRSPEEVFKNTYSFEFLNLTKRFNENDLENSLLRNVEKLLLEFGVDFSLAGRQKKIIIDQQIHTIDLEFFHRGIPCIVLADLKIGKFKSEYVGKMNKYLNYYGENKKYPWEKEPIGLIVCEFKGREEVHYALGGLANRIFVAEYRTKLPREKDIIKKLKSRKEVKSE